MDERTDSEVIEALEAEIAALKAENEMLRRRLHDQALRTYDGLVEENARLRTALENISTNPRDERCYHVYEPCICDVDHCVKVANEALKRENKLTPMNAAKNVELARLQAAEQMYAQQTSQLIDEVKRLKEALGNLHEID